jgi:hypothetical protein
MQCERYNDIAQSKANLNSSCANFRGKAPMSKEGWWRRKKNILDVIVDILNVIVGVQYHPPRLTDGVPGGKD